MSCELTVELATGRQCPAEGDLPDSSSCSHMWGANLGSGQCECSPQPRAARKINLSAPPVLYLEVALGEGKTDRIGLHGSAVDDPDLLAAAFAHKHQLASAKQERLSRLIRRYLTDVVPGLEESVYAGIEAACIDTPGCVGTPTWGTPVRRSASPTRRLQTSPYRSGIPVYRPSTPAYASSPTVHRSPAAPRGDLFPPPCDGPSADSPYEGSEDDGDCLPFGAAAATGALAHDLVEATKSISKQLAELRSQMDSLKGSEGLESIRRQIDMLQESQVQREKAAAERPAAFDANAANTPPSQEPAEPPVVTAPPTNAAARRGARTGDWLLGWRVAWGSLATLALVIAQELVRQYLRDSGVLEGSRLAALLADDDVPWYDAEVSDL